jgi:hypothetical protein
VVFDFYLFIVLIGMIATFEKVGSRKLGGGKFMELHWCGVIIARVGIESMSVRTIVISCPINNQLIWKAIPISTSLGIPILISLGIPISTADLEEVLTLNSPKTVITGLSMEIRLIRMVRIFDTLNSSVILISPSDVSIKISVKFTTIKLPQNTTS